MSYDINDLSLGAREEDELLAELRRDDPIHRDSRNGFWLITRHADIRQSSRSPELFSSEPHGPWHEFESHFSMQADDGASHHQTRRVVSSGFTPRVVSALEVRARRYADEAIDAVVRRGRCDLVQDLAVPVPMRIIADMLGIGEGNLGLFRDWVDAITSLTTGAAQPHPSMQATLETFSEYVAGIVAERTARPQEDLISAMLAGRGQGVLESFRRDPFPGVAPGDGVLGFIQFLVLAGSETTRHAISHGMQALMEYPEQRARLAGDRTLMPTAVEEILRWATPVRTMQRTVMRDVELRNTELRSGDRVVLVYRSGNRDEAIFERPEEFDVGRRPNDHLSFGWGTHFCLGANLARMEIRVVVDRLLARLPDLRPEPGTQPTRATSSVVNGLDRMPVVFTPVSTAA